MRGARVLLLAATVVLGSACATTAATVDDGVYLEGPDGLFIAVSKGRQSLLMTHELLDLRPCADARFLECFASDYVSFAYAAGSEKTWSSGGYEFRRAAPVFMTGRGFLIRAEVIESTQGASGFRFYYSERLGLLGWKQAGIDKKGQSTTTGYFRKNMRPAE